MYIYIPGVVEVREMLTGVLREQFMYSYTHSFIQILTNPLQECQAKLSPKRAK